MPNKRKGMRNYKALLRKGYFPSELPLAFTTVDFGDHADEIVEDWHKKGVFRKEPQTSPRIPKTWKSYTYGSLQSAEAEVLSKPKKGYERRNVHIVHPVPQALLSMEIGTHLKKIQKWLTRQTFSEDEIQIGTQDGRSIEGIKFSRHREKKRYLDATSDWVVTTDITRFYPSIYTHSIAWAAYGKEKVKRNLPKYRGSLADRIDILVRSCNRNQTIGIPIGPDTSRIIAEIISARIDDDYLEHNAVASPEKIDRLQDDWTVGVESFEDAEHVLSTISNVYRSYGLDINGSKTSIDHITTERQNAWIIQMRAFLSRKSKLSGTRLTDFLDLALTLQSQDSSARAVNYALSVVDNMSIALKDMPTLESFLIKSAAVAPLSMDQICRVILNQQHRTGALSVKRIHERFIRLTEIALGKGHLYEVIWLLYTLRGLKQPVDAKAICCAAGDVPSAAIALILMDMKSKKLIRGPLPIAKWQKQITEDSIRTSWTWLLAYEGIRNGWLKDKLGLMEKPLFEPLFRREIRFYDPRHNVISSSVAAKKRKQTTARGMNEIRKLLISLREIDFDDY